MREHDAGRVQLIPPSAAASTVVAGIAVAVLVSSFIFSTETLPSVVLCGFRAITGLPCPGCGMTRAFCSISHGELQDAWSFNPFSFLVYGGALILVGAPLWARYCPRLTDRALRSRGAIVVATILVLMLLVFGVCRIITALEQR